MAGRARFHALNDLLTKRAMQEFEPDEDEQQPTTLDYVCHWLSSGKTAKSLAEDLSATLPFPLDYAGLIRHLKSVHGDQVDKAIEDARTLAAYALTEEALDIVDAPAETSAEVARAASRARSRQWMAERYNASKFGQNKGMNVTLNVGSLHLDALRSVARGTAVLTSANGGTSATGLAIAPARIIDSPEGYVQGVGAAIVTDHE